MGGEHAEPLPSVGSVVVPNRTVHLSDHFIYRILTLLIVAKPLLC